MFGGLIHSTLGKLALFAIIFYSASVGLDGNQYERQILLFMARFLPTLCLVAHVHFRGEGTTSISSSSRLDVHEWSCSLVCSVEGVTKANCSIDLSSVV